MSAPRAEDAPLVGRNQVLELLRARSRRIEEVAIVSEGRSPALQELLGLARRSGVRVSYRTRDQLTAMAGTPHHQGVVARVAQAAYTSLDELLAIPGRRGEPAFFLALDQIQDPRNLGAILRSAEVTGVHGAIVPKHHAVGLTAAAAKSAVGAVEHVPVARETNMARALELLKQAGVWTVGAVVQGGRAPWDVDLSGPVCLVLGSEGAGLRPLVAKGCDYLVSIPTRGRIGSFNVGAAAAVLCYEVERQRMAKSAKLS